MSDTDKGAKITNISSRQPVDIAPGTRPEEVDPDWLTAANSVDRDFADEQPGEAAALDPSIPTRYDPVTDTFDGPNAKTLGEELGIPGLAESVELAQTARQPEGNESIRQVLEEARPKSRALSQAEREAQEAEARRLTQRIEHQRIVDEKELVAARKRFTEIDPQRKAAFRVALGIGILIFLTSALFSFPAVAATAELMLPVWAWLALVVPGFVEAFVVYFGVETVIWQARATNEHKYNPAQRANAQKMSDAALRWMLVFTGVAVISNGAHTFMGYERLGQLGTWQAWLGISLAALAPLSVVLITKRVSRLVFVYAIKG